MLSQTNKKWIPFLILVTLYLITRLTHLLNLPLFTDESIYIYWAKVIESTHAQWFISLTDGKPPLLIWMISLLLSIFPQDWYLIAGRLPSVLAGLVALIAIIKTGKLIFSSTRVGLISGFLYIISPMTLFYDRMALFDSMLNAMLLSAIYFAVRTGKYRKVLDALLWGGFLGLAFLSKPTALLFLPFTIFAAYITLDKKDLFKHGKHIALLSTGAILLGEAMNNLQRISSAYPAMIRKNQQFQQPFSELLSNPFALTLGNLQGFFGWTVAYYTLPFFIFGIISFIYGLKTKIRESLLLLVLWFMPLLILATVGREIFPRYILIVIPYFLLMASYLVERLLQFRGNLRYGVIVGLFLISIPLLRFDYLLVTKPENAPFPLSDANQYVFEHPSGYGLEEVYDFIREQSSSEKITVVTQGTFGLYPYAFYLEFWGNPNVNILPKWPLESLDSEILEAEKKGKVFIILKEHETVPPQLPLEVVLTASKPGGKYPLLVTQIKETHEP